MMRGMGRRWLVASVVLGSFLGLPLQAAAVAAQPARVSVTGLVVGPDGSAVPDAQVDAICTAVGDFDYEMRTDTVHTDEGGRFAFALRTERLYRPASAFLWVSADGFAVEWATCELDGDHELSVKLSEAARLAGTVVDETGAGVAGAEVRAILVVQRSTRSRRSGTVIGRTPLSGLTVRADDAGRFVFNNIPKDTGAEFVVAAPGKATIQTGKVDVRPEKIHFQAGEEDIRVVLPPQAVARGVLLRAGTKVPIVGQQLAAHGAVGRASVCVTGDDGTFELAGLGAGRHWIELVPPEDDRACWVARDPQVETEMGQTIENLTIECYRAGILEARVIDKRSRTPIEDAAVGGRSVAPLTWFSGPVCWEGGRSFRVIPATYSVEVTAPNYVRSDRQDVRIGAGGTTRLTVELLPAPDVKGVVLDPAGKPVANATVQVDEGKNKTRTDAQGRFELAAQKREMTGWDRGHVFSLWVEGPQRSLAVVQSLDYGPQTLQITLHPYRTIAGRVVDRDGKPVARAEVTADWRGKAFTAKTDPDGRYEFTRMPLLSPDQSFRLDAKAEDHSPNSMDVLLERTQGERIAVADLILGPAPLSVSGIVVDAEGRPLANIVVEAYSGGQTQWTARSDRDGKFTIEGLPEGKVWLYLPQSPAPYEVEAEAGAKNVRLLYWMEDQPPAAPAKPGPIP